MRKIFTRNQFIKAIVLIYTLSTISIFAIQLESNYRNTLLHHGFGAGEQALVARLLEVFTERPCEVVTIEKNENSVGLISSDCIKPPGNN